MRRALLRSPSFVRAAKRLVKKQPQVLATIRETLMLVESDAFDPRLRTHKLKGDLEGSWSCSGGYDLRFVFDFVQHEGTEAILLLSIGTHDEVY
ncbi:type II toxin-antitoxin system YafQ family toxin [Candidatus Sumerlaeota bacterium]|nr:type II toxin-antitoxin system YafQ family toxin [Candidatus Sumerlaeota bacterium]